MPSPSVAAATSNLSVKSRALLLMGILKALRW
jgi:hypothetical protein